MFTLIKRLQDFISNLKKNKGLWFGMITTASIVGIILCMYLLMTMTDSVSKEVYKTMAADYVASLDFQIESKRKQAQTVASVLIQNDALVGAIATGNRANIEQIKTNINNEFTKNGFSDYKANFYSVLNQDQIFRNAINTTITNKQPVFGIEVLSDGIFFVYLHPVERNGNIVGVIELKDSVHILKQQFVDILGNYVFVLNKRMLTFLSIEERTGKFKDITSNYAFDLTKYDSRFALTLTELGEDEFGNLISQPFYVDGGYYRTIKKVTDINGAEIGYMILGESTSTEGGFVNIADSMTKTVTTVALGLVTAMILFLF